MDNECVCFADLFEYIRKADTIIVNCTLSIMFTSYFITPEYP